MAAWTFLTNHARAMLYIAAHPDTRQVDLAAALGVTERTAHAIVTDLTTAGHVTKERDGRRNRYRVLGHLPLPESNNAVLRELNSGRDRTVGELLGLLVDLTDEEDPRTDS